MTSLTVYDPAMCCSTGICGADVDQNLVTFAADLDWLKSSGIDVTRINISNEPMKFVENAKVKSVLDSDGVDGLPVVLVDGETRSKGCFPDRAEMAGWVGVEFSAPTKEASAGCCSDDKKETASSCC